MLLMEVSMNWLKFSLLIFSTSAMITLASCAQSASSSKLHCSDRGEICIQTSMSPTFTANNPIVLTIKVTSSKDLSDLGVTLTTPGDITVDGPQNWESNLSSTYFYPGQAMWTFNIKAGQTLTFNRVLHFISKGGWFSIVTNVSNVGGTIYAVDNFRILLTNNTGNVIREGTPLPPYTTNVTAAAYGPGTPAPTFLLPSITPTPFIKTSPSSTPFSPLLETSYPPPSSPTPTPTPQSSPYP